MKTHIRILYTVAVAALVTAGFALKAQNDARASQLASAPSSTTTTTATTTTSTIGSAP